jgi:hypothetical protein
MPGRRQESRHILIPLHRTGGSRHVNPSLPAAPGGGSFGHRHGCLARVLLCPRSFVTQGRTRGAAILCSCPTSSRFPAPAVHMDLLSCTAPVGYSILWALPDDRMMLPTTRSIRPTCPKERDHDCLSSPFVVY